MTHQHKFILAIIIASFVAQLSIIGYLFVYQHNSYASIINISGKQRMLSQRIALSETVLNRAKQNVLAANMDELTQLTNMATGGLLQALDIAVWQFQREADDELNARTQMVSGILILMLLTFLFGMYEFNVFLKQIRSKNTGLALSKFVFDNSADGIITTDGGGVILTANSPVRDLIGYAPGAIIGRKLRSLVSEIALHDKLTGLLNRTAIYQEFKSKVAVARREKSQICVLMMDLDGFKKTNDSFGHDAGDHVLLTLSERMLGAIRDSDTLARFGGDEFIVLLWTVTRECQSASNIELGRPG